MQNIPLSGYKTFILAAVVAVLGALQTLNWASVVPAQDVGPVMIGIGAAIAILRSITSTPAGK